MDPKKRELISFLDEKIFNTIKQDKTIPKGVRSGLHLTRARLTALPPESIISYFWSAITGTPRSLKMYQAMKACKLITFEDIMIEFREKFNDNWIRTI
jgi:hypothetical protein